MVSSTSKGIRNDATNQNVLFNYCCYNTEPNNYLCGCALKIIDFHIKELIRDIMLKRSKSSRRNHRSSNVVAKLIQQQRLDLNEDNNRCSDGDSSQSSRTAVQPLFLRDDVNAGQQI
uniref:Uncharacterized protein n=1 Tax=Glossina pallidipes TaxID=7398 RepID=A0A1B0AIV5_GLOPL